MEHWDGSVLDINGTCADIGQICLQHLGMHAADCSKAVCCGVK